MEGKFSQQVAQEIDGKGKRRLPTFLHGAGLIEANNPAVRLVGANLRGADLYGADLREAFLQGARGVDNQSLDRGAGSLRSLKDTIMPNGQKFEDWLKDQESRTKDA